jgi:general secretion pathway protein A
MLVDFGVISHDDLSHLPVGRDALLATLRSFLASLSAVQATALVFIDDAQRLPLEVLGQLPHLAGPDSAEGLLQLVLVGQPGLVWLLRRPALRELDRQLVVRCVLEPLLQGEVLGYIGHRLSVAGSSSRVEFDDEAVLRLYELSGGVPRTINLLCDGALALGSRQLAAVIDARLVGAAADALGVTPPVTPTERFVRGAVLGLGLFALGIAGAGGALWVFRDQVARTLVQWTHPAQVPAGPVPDLPVPLPSIPLPASGPDAALTAPPTTGGVR